MTSNMLLLIYGVGVFFALALIICVVKRDQVDPYRIPNSEYDEDMLEEARQVFWQTCVKWCAGIMFPFIAFPLIAALIKHPWVAETCKVIAGN